MIETNTRPLSILLVEDDPAVATMLKDVLELKGYRVWPAESGADALLILKDSIPDLVVLDLMLPDVSGLVLFMDIKAIADVPLIVCSGTKRKEDAVLALRLGAEDFVPKPFSSQELQARIEGVLRRARVRGVSDRDGETVLEQFDSLVVDRTRCRATVDGADASLTPTEFRLVALLVARADEVLSKKELAEAVWGEYDPDIGRTLDVHMRRLRAKVRPLGQNGPFVETVRGFGYRLTRNG